MENKRLTHAPEQPSGMDIFFNVFHGSGHKKGSSTVSDKRS